MSTAEYIPTDVEIRQLREQVARLSTENQRIKEYRELKERLANLQRENYSLTHPRRRPLAPPEKP